MKLKINTSLMKNIKTPLKLEFETGHDHLFDDLYLESIKRVIKDKERFKAKTLVLVGVGGSSNGVKALARVRSNLRMNVLFAESFDAESLIKIKCCVESELKKGNKVLINAVSKSGMTAESIAGLEVIVKLLKSYEKDWTDYLIITSDIDSPLTITAKKLGVANLIIPRRVQGRYSIFTAVGLLPLGLLGFDIDSLIEGARSALIEGAMKTALIKSYYYAKGLFINVLFPFTDSLEGLKDWWEQLLAESLGKDGKGLTPLTAVGTRDLHSLLQLFLGGPKDKFTTFIKILKSSNLIVPQGVFTKLIKGLGGKSIKWLSDATYDGVINSYKKNESPYVEIILNDLSERSLGQLLQHLMYETIILGALMGVNTQNQPDVENYKSFVRRKLSQ